MKEAISANKCLRLSFDEEQRILTQRWENVKNEYEYKACMNHLVEFALENQPITYHLVYPDLGFPIDPDLQEWTNTYVFAAIKYTGLTKCAFIVPQEVYDTLIIEFIGITQTMEEEKEGYFQTMYFTYKDKALAWFELNKIES